METSIITLSLVFALLLCPCLSGGEAEFDYVGKKGPSHWADLKEEWKACGKGHMQSPIDLTQRNTKVFPSLGMLHKSYKPSLASIKNRGHDVMLKWINGAGNLHIDGTNYTLMQCHWHSPSEHTIHGKRYPLEIHLVHQTHDNKAAVIGILYEYGRHDPFIAVLTRNLMALKENKTQGAEEAVGVVNPKMVKMGSRKYFRYVGSLTTPPCTEGVIWIIVDKVRTVSRGQVNMLLNAVHDGAGHNARPLQSIDGRVVEMYNPLQSNNNPIQN